MPRVKKPTVTISYPLPELNSRLLEAGVEFESLEEAHEIYQRFIELRLGKSVELPLPAIGELLSAGEFEAFVEDILEHCGAFDNLAFLTEEAYNEESYLA